MPRRKVKLVRDKIALFKENLSIVYAPIEDDDDYIIELRKKLCEEAVEYALDPCAGELGDVVDVCRALCKEDLGITPAELADVMETKTSERGAFDEGIGMFVEWTDYDVPIED